MYPLNKSLCKIKFKLTLKPPGSNWKPRPIIQSTALSVMFPTKFKPECANFNLQLNPATLPEVISLTLLYFFFSTALTIF